MQETIENYYKNIDRPIINNYINNCNLKILLELSTITDLYVFTKKKREWILKDKRILLHLFSFKTPILNEIAYK